MNGSNYQAIAEILAGDLATSSTEAERLKVRGITLSLADYFLSENPRFVRDRFYSAVGINNLRTWREEVERHAQAEAQ